MTSPKSKALKTFHDVELVHWQVLVPADYNPRRMTRARARQLAASLVKFGLTLPIIALRDTKEIIGGHQRVLRVADLVAAGTIPKSQMVPVIWRDDLTPADARKLNIALNEIDGELVTEGYAALLRDIAKMDGGSIEDLEAMGLTDDDLTALLDAVDVPKEQLDAMAKAADPKAGGHDQVVIPVKAYKLTIPTSLAEEFIEPVFKAFGHEALEILGEHGGRVAKFDGESAAFVAACRAALRSRRNGVGTAPVVEAPVVEAPAPDPDAPPPAAPPKTRRAGKKAPARRTTRKRAAAKKAAARGTR